MWAAEAGRKGEQRGEPVAAKPQADPFDLAESDRLGGSVVADILVMLWEEREVTRRMAVAGAQRQLTAPNVPAAAMKSILLAVRRKEEGKGRRGRTGAGAAEGRDSGVRTEGQAQRGKGGKGQLGASGAKKSAGHQEGKAGRGGGQGHQWPQSQHLFRQLQPGVTPTGQRSGAARGKEGGAPPADGAVQGAGTH